MVDACYLHDVRKVHGLRRACGLDEDGYRDLVGRVSEGRTTSLKELRSGERSRLIGELARRAPPREGGGRRYTNAYARKAQALWITAYWLGTVENKSHQALEDFARRQTGVDRIEWLQAHTDSARAPRFGTADASKVIDAIKQILKRTGFDPDVPARVVKQLQARRADGRPLAPGHATKLEAILHLWRRLHAAGAVRIASEEALDSWVEGAFRVRSRPALDERQADLAMERLGRWLRQAEGG